MEQDTETKSASPAAPLHKERGWRGWVIYIVIMIALWLFFEFLGFQLQISIWYYINIFWARLISVFFVIASGVLPYILDHKKISFARAEGTPFWTDAWRLIKRLFKRYLRQNTLAGLVLLVIIGVNTSAFAAEHHAAQALYTFLTTPHPVEKEVEPTPQPDGSEDVVLPESENTTEEMEEDNKDEDAEEKTDGEADQDAPLAERLDLNTAEPDDLTSEEYDKIFFLTGDHAVACWDLEETVAEAVRDFVQECASRRLPTNYDQAETPTHVQDSIALASAYERRITTAEELEQVIATRSDIYQAYPGYTLCKLLRENYGLYGDAYKAQGKSDSAAFSYYGTSILWGFQALEYNTSKQLRCKDLRILEERYEKIAQVAQSDSFAQHYAKKLSNAFGQVADEMEAGNP